jgi:hypothetical protein
MKYHKIEELLANNQSWVAEKLAENPTYFEDLARGQKPPFLYIGCCDSRLPSFWSRRSQYLILSATERSSCGLIINGMSVEIY